MTDVIKGVRVVELSTVITAPLTGLMLADLGAEVIKVEPPGGDPFRSFRGGQYSPNFVAYNRGKRSIKLDLRTDAGRSILLELVARADVLLENYRPGIMAKLGLGEDILQAANARLIHCSITGFGETGPTAPPACDNVAVALRDLSLQSIRCIRSRADRRSRTMPPACTRPTAFSARCTTRAHRPRPPRRGQHAGGRHRLHPDPFANYIRAGIMSDRLTRVAASQSFAFRCGDGKLLAVHLSSQPKFFEALAAALERPDLLRDERFATRDLRVRNFGDLTRILGEIVGTKPRLHWMQVLEENDVPFAPVNNLQDVLDDPQVRHLGTFYKQEPSDRRRDHSHPSAGADRRRARGTYIARADARRAHRHRVGGARL